MAIFVLFDTATVNVLKRYFNVCERTITLSPHRKTMISLKGKPFVVCKMIKNILPIQQIDYWESYLSPIKTYEKNHCPLLK